MSDVVYVAYITNMDYMIMWMVCVGGNALENSLSISLQFFDLFQVLHSLRARAILTAWHALFDILYGDTQILETKC